MSKVAATQPGGSANIIAAASLNFPQAVGKSSEFTPAFTEGISEFPLGYERSWIIRNKSEWGFGINPRGDVRNGPIRPSSSSGEYPAEYRPAACSLAMYSPMNLGSKVDEW